MLDSDAILGTDEGDGTGSGRGVVREVAEGSGNEDGDEVVG